jgi:hypothetical protein
LIETSLAVPTRRFSDIHPRTLAATSLSDGRSTAGSGVVSLRLIILISIFATFLSPTGILDLLRTLNLAARRSLQEEPDSDQGDDQNKGKDRYQCSVNTAISLCRVFPYDGLFTIDYDHIS